MTAAAPDLEQVRTQAETHLADARERRERLSLDALAGDETAATELAGVEEHIGELERQIERADLAAGEKARRDRIAEAELERKQRAQARREAEAASARREKALREVRASLATLSQAVSRFLQYEAELQDASVRAHVNHIPLAEPIGELIVVKLRDAGIPGEAFTEWIPAAHRKRLLARFAEPDPLTKNGSSDEAGEAAVAVATCTICSHDDRAAIEADLAAGGTLREIEERHGVSRSALSRHRRHNETSKSETAA